MNSAVTAAVKSYIDQEKLPASYLKDVERWFLPVLEEILQQVASHSGTYVIGVSGCQGSGKSTLAGLLVILLQEVMGLRGVSLSIDDFYLTHAQRQTLAADVHPLLATRGVPGTHDVELALSTMTDLETSGEVAIPRFDKGRDDRSDKADWPRVQGPVDVIVLEGWCLGIEAQSDAALVTPVNRLEAEEDSDGRWRRHVNDRLKQHYQAWYEQMDFLVMLKAPDFEKVFQWRRRQEEKLAEKLAAQHNSEQAGSRLMSEAQLVRFIQHYERLTRHGLETLPGKADVVFQLNDDQIIEQRL